MATRDKNAKKVLLIDCDPGVDDCVALMMALAQAPEVKVVGITCANGNVGVHQVTLNATRILKLMDMIGHVPIFRGCEEPILVMPQTGDASFYHGKDGLGDAPHADPPCHDDLLQHVEEEHAVTAISRLSKEYEGRLQLLCIGAMTNVALAFKLDPDLPKRLKSLHILGGTIRGHGNATPCAEYNFHTDPEAAYIVLRSFPDKCPVQVLTYEVTTDHAVPVEWFDKLISRVSKRNRFFQEVFKLSQEYEHKLIAAGVSPGYVICDAYLVCVVLDPSAIKKSKHLRMGIELAGHIARGSLIIDHGEKGSPHLSTKPIELIQEIDHDIYKGFLSQAFGQS